MLSARCAGAQVLYQQPPQDNGGAAISSTVNNAGQPIPRRCADDFLIPAPAAPGADAAPLDTAIYLLDWWGRPNSGGYDFTFTFYDDVGGLPGNILHTTQGTLSVTGPLKFGGITDTYAYSSRLTSPFLATPLTKYWISIYNQAPGASWLWRTQEDIGPRSSVQGNAAPPYDWTMNPNLTFRLMVPEPTGVGIAAASLFIMALRRARAAKPH